MHRARPRCKPPQLLSDPQQTPLGPAPIPTTPQGLSLFQQPSCSGRRRMLSPTPAPEPGAKGGPRLAAHSYPSNKTLTKPQIRWLKACRALCAYEGEKTPPGRRVPLLDLADGHRRTLGARCGTGASGGQGGGGSKRQAALPALPARARADGRNRRKHGRVSQDCDFAQGKTVPPHSKRKLKKKK